MADFNPNKPLGGVLGSTAELKVLDLMLSVPKHGYNISELARASQLARATCDRVVKHLVEWRILQLVESRGNVDSYWLNEESDHIAALRDFHFTSLFGGRSPTAASSFVIQTVHQSSFDLQAVGPVVSGFSPSMGTVAVNASLTPATLSSLSPMVRSRTGEVARIGVETGAAVVAI